MFDTIDQTEALPRVAVPVLAVGGEASLGERQGELLRPLCSKLTSASIPDCGHFVPDEAPDALVDLFLSSFGGLENGPPTSPRSAH